MNRLSSLSAVLRTRTSIFSNINASSSVAATLRGPKKKKGGGGDTGPISKDIVNIHKGREDPLIYPSDMYPPFVMELLEQQYSPDDVMLQLFRGERLPTAKEQWTLAKSLRRQALFDRNTLIKQRAEYESDDDHGEDLGGTAGQQDLDEEAAGEISDDD